MIFSCPLKLSKVMKSDEPKRLALDLTIRRVSAGR
jgi:hypothetical protein